MTMESVYVLSHTYFLQLAVIEAHEDSVLQWLQEGADVNVKNNHGNTLLHEIVLINSLPSHDDESIGCYLRIIKSLLLYGLDINMVNDKEETALMLAVAQYKKCRRIKMVSFLLELGASTSVKNRKGQTALHLAVRFGNAELIELLLAWKSDVVATDLEGNTPLHHTVKQDNIPLTLLLLERGANVDAVNKEGHTVLHTAIKFWASTRCIEMLVENNANVNAKLRNGSNALHMVFSCPHRHLYDIGKIARTLILGGVDVNSRSHKNKIALHYAVELNDMHTVRLLLMKRSKVNEPMSNGRTALHVSLYNMHADITNLLLFYGADLTIRDQEDRTPLDLAQNRFISLQLIKHLAKLDLSNLNAEYYQKINSCEKYFDYYVACRSEIEKMKVCSVGFGTTLYDVLTKCENDLNYNITKNASEANVYSAFPNYNLMLTVRIQRVSQRKLLHNAVENRLDFFWRHFRVPHLPMQKILHYIDNEDMQTMALVLDA